MKNSLENSLEKQAASTWDYSHSDALFEELEQQEEPRKARLLKRYSFLKKRIPLVCVILSFITLGIYLIYWTVVSKNEMNKLGANIPTAWLLIVPIGNLYFDYKYCEGYADVLDENQVPLLWFVITVVFPPVWILLKVLIQIQLNHLADQEMVV